jgi:hypothetical protein
VLGEATTDAVLDRRGFEEIVARLPEDRCY